MSMWRKDSTYCYNSSWTFFSLLYFRSYSVAGEETPIISFYFESRVYIRMVDILLALKCFQIEISFIMNFELSISSSGHSIYWNTSDRIHQNKLWNFLWNVWLHLYVLWATGVFRGGFTHIIYQYCEISLLIFCSRFWVSEPYVFRVEYVTICIHILIWLFLLYCMPNCSYYCMYNCNSRWGKTHKITTISAIFIKLIHAYSSRPKYTAYIFCQNSSLKCTLKI